jgi:ABC-type antimicrobial peptide transport system permease subunit
VAGALVLSRFLAGQLYGVRATDPLTYGALAALLAAVALASASLPALRATRVDPVEALRSE